MINNLLFYLFFIMNKEEIELFIKELDEQSRDMCVQPESQNFDCEDCYLCRVAFFNRVRKELGGQDEFSR